MRFETSQTTPSFLDRRLQRRMLSFVGLISMVLISLGVMNNRLKTENPDGRSNVSPDSLTYEVHREERSLKPDEVIIGGIPVDNEPRGQWADASPRDRSRDDGANQDRGLFKPRKQERTADNRLFTRRSIPNSSADAPQSRQVPPSNDQSEFDDERFDAPRTSHRPEPTQSPAAQTIDDDWISTPGPAPASPPRLRNQDDNSPPTSRGPIPHEPISDDPILRESPHGNSPRFEPSDSLDQIPQINSFDRPIDEGQQPFRTGRPENDPMESPREIGTRNDDNIIRDGAPLGRRFKKSRPVNDIEPNRAPFDDEPIPTPQDLGRGSRTRTYTDDTEPFREDLASVPIDKRYLDPIKDNTLGIRKDESEVFYWLLDHARRASSAALERAGLSDVQYVNLMTEPDQFRGEPITIEGDLWRLYEIEAGRNEYGVTRFYEGWVFTGDSGNHPYRIVCTSLARGIEPGENLRKPVRITGYFFKREGYRSNGGVHVAPTLLAHRIGINPMPNGIPLMAGIVPYMIGAIMAVGMALLVTIVAFAISDERSSRAGPHRLRAQPHVSFAGMPIPTPIPVEETLRQFAESQREAAVSGAYGPLLTRQTREHAVHDETMSRQLMIDQERRQHERQTGAVQNWAARQQANQSEIDALRAANGRQSPEDWNAGAELDSDKLDPARNVLFKFPSTRFVPVEQPERAQGTFAPSPLIQVPSAIVPPSVPTPIAPMSVSSGAGFQPATLTKIENGRLDAAATSISTLASNPHPVVSQLHSVVTPLPPASNISYGASKLSEWEDEVTKLNNRAATRPFTNQMGTCSAELSAAAQLERDRLAREQEIRDRIQRQQAESERLHREQLERDRIEHERMERERKEHEQREHDRIVAERALSEHSDHHSTTFTLAPSVAERIELEQLERERLEREHHERERLERERYEHERLIHERAAAAEWHEHNGTTHSHAPSANDHEQTRTHREYDRHIDPAHSDPQSSADSYEDRSSNDESDVPKSGGAPAPGTNWGRNRKRRRNWRDGQPG